MRPPERYNFVTQTRYGTLVYNKNDVRVGRSLELYGEYCERAIVVFDQILAPGQVVIDVGANIGAHTLFFAKKVGPAGCVLAFEPQRLVYQTLCGNMAINSITNVHCWNAAVGDHRGEICVPRVDHEREIDLTSLEIGGTEGERVPVIELDGMNLPRCNLVRIALPGMEFAVLDGASCSVEAHQADPAHLQPARCRPRSRAARAADRVGLCRLLALGRTLQPAQSRRQHRERVWQPGRAVPVVRRQGARAALERLYQSDGRRRGLTDFRACRTACGIQRRSLDWTLR